MGTPAPIAAGQPVFRIIYSSTARIGSAMADQLTAYGSILDASRRNNARVGVTGALMICGDRFAQVLEGPEQAVRETYARIERDPRHTATRVLRSESGVPRVFSAWAMAHLGAGSGRAVSLSQSASLEAAVGDAVHGGDRVVALLRDLAREGTDQGARAA